MSTSASLTDPRPSTSPQGVAQRSPTVSPFVDVFENASELLLVADVPGASPDSVDVHIDNGEITLSARRAAPEGASPTEHRGYDYHRVFALPRGIDGSKVGAELAAGVLRVHLPKSDALKPRRIDVKSS